jgi:hypothetical protein
MKLPHQLLPQSVRMQMAVAVAYLLRQELRSAGARLYLPMGGEKQLQFDFREAQKDPPLPAVVKEVGILYSTDRQLSGPELGGGAIGMGLAGHMIIEVELSVEGVQYFDNLNMNKQDS